MKSLLQDVSLLELNRVSIYATTYEKPLGLKTTDAPNYRRCFVKLSLDP